MPYSLHEPAPTRTTFGRGGVGNHTRPLPPSTIKDPSSSQPHPPHKTSPNYSTGRGGVGNMHHTSSSSSDRRIFSFDEELAKQGKVSAAPVYHIGRGGQGNLVVERRESDASSSGSGKGSGESKRSSLEWVRGLARSGKA